MSSMRFPNFPPAALAWSVWGLGALLYLIGFYQRVAPAVITDRLMTCLLYTSRCV